MYENEFKQIINAAKNHSLTFFVGAGVSRISGAPSWNQIIEKICDKLKIKTEKKIYSTDESLKLAQMLYIALNQDTNAYHTFINECLTPINKRLEPNVVHKELFDLNPVSFITTNFDELLEISAMQYCQSFVCVAKDADVPKVNGSKYILKIHGDIKNQNIVFKEEDYLNYSENFKLIETLLKSIFSTNTVVFIGYGLNDYNVKLILNWAKSLLNEQFNKPIFIYIDDDELTEIELSYQKARGLKVIDWHKINNNLESNDYLQRYMIILNAIKNSQDIYLEGKSKEEAFDILYTLLEPLNELQALRAIDIREKLGKYVYVGEYNNRIIDDKYKILLQYFYEIHTLSILDRMKLEQNIQNKYQTILNIFIKARIQYISLEDKKIVILQNTQTSFANANCLHFNYESMREFINIENNTIQNKYMKAFYLYKLNKYNEALEIFTSVAKEAYLDKNYLLYYLCEINNISMNKLSSIYNYHKKYESLNISISAALIDDYNNIFNNLPVEFQNKYANLNNLYSIKQFLQEYSYIAFLDAANLKHSIDTNSIELGLTSSNKAISRINEYLHFILGNGLVIDIFTEYRNTITYIMEILVHKYSVQNKKHLAQHSDLVYVNDNIVFDYIDFYCFLEYFEKDAIKKLFNRYDIQLITFQQQEIIENNIKNILINYEYVINNNSSEIEILFIKEQIKKLIVLLKYMNISQDLMNYFCNFLLNNKFYEMYSLFEIEEYVLFFDTQIGVKKLYNEASEKLLIKSLLYFLDIDIKSAESNKKMFLYRYNINYHYLIHYIYPQENIIYNRSINTRISYIIKNKLNHFIDAIFEHYMKYITPYMKQKLYKYLNNQLDNNFDINQFTYLLYNKKRVSQDLIYKAKQYLESILKDINKPNFNHYDIKKLEHIGYLCMIKLLNKKDFLDFLGKSDLFDFFVLYKDFDYLKFKVEWLLPFYPQTLKIISENHFVREKIRSCIIEVLKNDNIIDIYKTKLTQILITYFY